MLLVPVTVGSKLGNTREYPRAIGLRVTPQTKRNYVHMIFSTKYHDEGHNIPISGPNFQLFFRFFWERDSQCSCAGSPCSSVLFMTVPGLSPPFSIRQKCRPFFFWDSHSSCLSQRDHKELQDRRSLLYTEKSYKSSVRNSQNWTRKLPANTECSSESHQLVFMV